MQIGLGQYKQHWSVGRTRADQIPRYLRNQFRQC